MSTTTTDRAGLRAALILVGALVAACQPSNPAPAKPSATPSPVASASAQPAPSANGLDARVKRFLDEHRDEWRDYNVPYVDGQVLHDLVVDRGHKSILEIGTSTGHSTIWLAWAASKVGGAVITIEIDESRHRQAVSNVREAGLSKYVDFRLADAH